MAYPQKKKAVAEGRIVETAAWSLEPVVSDERATACVVAGEGTPLDIDAWRALAGVRFLWGRTVTYVLS